MKIFIAYQSRDVKFVDMISTTLTRIGHEPVVVENTSLPGENITSKVLSALNQFDIFMPIITRNSINSQWLNQEIGYAIAKKSTIFQGINISFDFILPIIEKSTSSNIKGFLVNIEGIGFERNNPELTIANVVQVLFNSYSQGMYNIRFTEICRKCKSDMSITFPNYELIYEAIIKEQHYYVLCETCNEIYQYSPLTLQIKKHWTGTQEEIENIFS